MDRASGKSRLSNRKKPNKACTVCGEKIVWHRRLASEWDSLLYCSASCRRISVASGRQFQNVSKEDYGLDEESAA